MTAAEQDNAAAAIDLIAEYGEEIRFGGKTLSAFVEGIERAPGLAGGGEVAESTLSLVILKDDWPQTPNRKTAAHVRGSEYWMESSEDYPGVWIVNCRRAYRRKGVHD